MFQHDNDNICTPKITVINSRTNANRPHTFRVKKGKNTLAQRNESYDKLNWLGLVNAFWDQIIEQTYSNRFSRLISLLLYFLDCIVHA